MNNIDRLLYGVYKFAHYSEMIRNMFKMQKPESWTNWTLVRHKFMNVIVVLLRFSWCFKT